MTARDEARRVPPSVLAAGDAREAGVISSSSAGLHDERLRFEPLLLDLSTTFVNLPADEIDARIEDFLGRIVRFLGVERSTLGEFSEDGTELRTTHSFAEPGFPPFPAVILDTQFPWYTARLRRGHILRYANLSEGLPAEAVAEREYALRTGFKSHLAIPLSVGGVILGAVGFGSFRDYREWPDELVPRLGLVGEVFANALARSRAERALRRSERRYRDLLESTRAVPWESDPRTHRIRYIGPQAVPLLGYPLEAWYEDGFWASHLHPDDRGRVLDLVEGAVGRGEDLELEYRLISESRGEVWVQGLISAPRGDVASPSLHGVLIDVTARRTAEAETQSLRDQLAHVARASTMGELAAAIAHEINQPLCAIVSNAQAARRILAIDCPDLDEVCDALRDIASDGRRSSEILARIRTMLEKHATAPAPLDLNFAIREVVALMQDRLASKAITLSLDLAADLPHALADRVQIQQVVLNLMINADEAMSRVGPGPREMSLRSTRSGGEVLVSLHDSGPGIDPRHVESVFDAFFTTKSSGLGIGLAISRTIVAAHGGRLWADPAAHQGATFHLALPVAEGHEA